MYKTLTISTGQTLAGIIAGVMSYFVHNILPLVVCVIIFEAVDFVTGVWKSRVLAKRWPRCSMW